MRVVGTINNAGFAGLGLPIGGLPFDAGQDDTRPGFVNYGVEDHLPSSTNVTARASLGAKLTAWGVTDMLATNQWYLGHIGDLGAVWAEFTGRGVTVGIYDSGVDTRVADLAKNYDASKEVVVDGVRYEGSWRPAAGPHGSAVAGVIAGARDGQGIVGVAYDSTYTSVNIFDPYAGGGRDPGIFINAPDRTKFLAAFERIVDFDITNHSWGPSSPSKVPEVNRANPDSYATKFVGLLANAAANGRDGLGSIAVKATGNYGGIVNNQEIPRLRDGNADSIGNDRHWVSVAAHREVDGYASSYSARGAHLLISAPSDDFAEIGGTAIWTTDALGREGWNTATDPGGALDHTDRFGGTSHAAPTVSAAVALMLDANEGLGWRDVKNILAASARMPVAFETGPTSRQWGTTIYSLNEDRFQIAGERAGGQINGGGYHYSTDYGYGALDAYSAVRMAEVWNLFSPAKTSANEVNVVAKVELDAVLPTAAVNGTLAGLRWTDFKINVTDRLDIEHLDLHYSYSYERPGFLVNYTATFLIRVTSPEGTVYEINTSGLPSNFGPVENGPGTEVVSLAGLRGEMSEGTWTVSIASASTLPTTTLYGLKLDFFGSASTNDDVYTYTNEFLTMVAIDGEGGRRTLSDTDGGTDWINAAAVAANADLSLLEGATTRFGGEAAFTIATGSRIEHAVTGDGNDRLFGNALDNRLYGMRGNDWLNGGAGNDTLFGGQGRDVFAFDTAGVSGRDVILDWSVGDRIATSKELRGADQNGLVTVGSNALVLLDGNARGDTAELSGQGGAVLQAFGKSDGYWWYGFVSDGDSDFVDGRVIELALSQTGRPANDTGAAVNLSQAVSSATALQDAAFYLYDTMGDAMVSGVQTYA